MKQVVQNLPYPKNLSERLPTTTPPPIQHPRPHRPPLHAHPSQPSLFQSMADYILSPLSRTLTQLRPISTYCMRYDGGCYRVVAEFRHGWAGCVHVGVRVCVCCVG